jgi:ATP-dependent protease HslVU (ClpYQ) peptidase subunit
MKNFKVIGSGKYYVQATANASIKTKDSFSLKIASEICSDAEKLLGENFDLNEDQAYGQLQFALKTALQPFVNQK